MLDATAGNRIMWPYKNPPNVVFMDRELKLGRPPHIFADFRFCPFRENVFETVIFDPPHKITRNMPPWWNSPEMDKNPAGSKWPGSTKSWYGFYETKIEMLSSIYKGQKEFARIAKRLCLKWSEISVPLWNILPLFDEWEKKHEVSRKMKTGKIPHFWITFIRSSLRMVSEKVLDTPEILLSDILDSQVIENGATPTTN